MLKTIHHTFLWLVALSVLNSSIDIVETVHTAYSRDTATSAEYNEIESIVEYFIDEATDHQQQLPDTKGNNEQSLMKKMAAFDFSMPVKKEKLVSPVIVNTSNIPLAINNSCHLPAGYTTRIIQPPDLS